MNNLISREAAIIALMDVEADQIQTKNGISVNNNVIGQFDMEWWNSPYKRGETE